LSFGGGGGGGPIVPFGFWVFLPLVVVGIWLNLVGFVLSCVLCYGVEDAWLCGDGCWLVGTSLSTIGLCFLFIYLNKKFLEEF